MNILFIHQNFPGQYKHLAPALAKKGHKVVAVGMANRSFSDIEYVKYKTKRGTTRDVHPWVIDYEAKVIRAEACAEACLKLKQSGFTPDVICAHPGWGEALLLREVWPETPQLHFVEFYYGAIGRDVGFDPEFPTPEFSGRCRLNIKNTNNLMNLIGMDAGISPTTWQKSTVPDSFQDKISVIHDGIDTVSLTPDSSAVLNTKTVDGVELTLTKDDQVVTFVNRNLEPNRGYHQFMRALPDLLKGSKDAQVVIIGGDGVSYGAAPKQGSWKQIYLNEVADKIDMSRVHFLGSVPYDVYKAAMRISSAHVYLTYPFVLSWSMLESMSMGVPLIASSTSPVIEVVEDGVNGWLVDFFDPAALASKIIEVLVTDTSAVCERARATIVERYDLNSVCLPKQIELVEKLANTPK
ncbi:MAG: glycosyltransferase [Gammaproteobacteria bacterium]|nr:glycosyltransferase [Gammaproteobacteria bacterium]